MNEEPLCKKMKFDSAVPNFPIITDHREKIQMSTRNLQAVLDDKLTAPVPQIKVYAGCMKNRKDISRAIKILNDKMPLSNLNHLKRVCNNVILLSPLIQVEGVTIQKYVDEKIPELRDVFECFKVVPVPKDMPALKSQYKKENTTWPCNFHPDAYLENLAGSNFFSNTDLEAHRLHMLIAFDSMKWYFQTNGFTDATHDMFWRSNVTVVVDPEINSVVAISVDNRLNHPVQHSTMLAIDNVAKTQNGGAWNSNTYKTFTENSAERIFNGIDDDLLLYLKKHYVKVNFGAKQYKSKKDLEMERKSNVDGPYLCTNYYIYTIREPCLMCSMALVHARARRVFFCLDNPEFGALKSKTKLQTVSSLNHHYEVFTGFL